MSALADVAFEAREGGVLVARVSGEIDLSSAGHVRSKIDAAVPNDALGLVVDLAGVTYLDSTGIGLLFELGGRLARRQQQLRVAIPETSHINRVLALVDLNRAVPVHTDLDEAAGEIRAATPTAGP